MLGAIVILGAFFSFNIFIISHLISSPRELPLSEPSAEEQIVANVKALPSSYWNKNPEYDDVFYQLQIMFSAGVKPLWSKSPAQLWKLVNQVRGNG